jgi:UDP-2-acetamido-2-deoxy-ribo-hexuluronate aminotransferase
MDTLQCAIILAKLERFEWEVQQREQIGQRYNQLLDQIGITRVQQRLECTSVFAQYTIMVPNREALQKRLANVGIPTAVHYPLSLNDQPAYKHLCCGDCTPVARELTKRVMSLPMSADLTSAAQSDVVAELLTYTLSREIF